MNVPLDVEAEMQAVLDAVSGLPGSPAAQVRILEVASLGQIRHALERDVFHVLHLSAHGSATTVELEDEDGGPVPVTAGDLMQVLRQAGRPVPLIVLSSCSGGSASDAMAAGLVGRGADRVIAMLAPVTDGYATILARRLYQQLAARPGDSVGQALARARRLAEDDRTQDDPDRVPLPEYGVATLLAAGGDGPLTDPAAPAAPLPAVTELGGGRSVRELPAGVLIGRRAQLRTAMRVLRRDPAAVRQFGAAGGVVLTGIGGIGKTALAGRIIARLREDGWLIAVHEGRWNPSALITATAHALSTARPGTVSPRMAAAARRLADAGIDDGPKLAAVAGLLQSCRLLVLFDDFEQNLTPGGQDFLDPAAGEVITALADAAGTGALLVTCRYPLPGPDRFLAEIPVPALSPAELRRMFLRLPALAGLDPDSQQLITRVIGGHPRLIEFTDALLRGGRSSLRHVQTRLRDLAAHHDIDLHGGRPVTQAIDQAMILGSADILLTELLALLTPRQAAVLAQIAVCRAPMTTDDLAYTLTTGPGPAGTGFPGADTPPGLAGLRADTGRLADLTLLAPGADIAMHPWTAAMVTRNTPADPDRTAALHERALAMRLRRFQQHRGTYEDLLDIPRHLAALGRYDDIASIAGQAMRMLPGTLAAAAYLAEISPLIPPDQRAWTIVAELEAQALLNAGNLPAATRQLEAIHQQDQARAAADPANTEWQRDLSVSRNKLGDVAAAAGDLTAARGHYQASLDIRTRLAAADPANTEWQRDLSVSRNKLGDVAAAAGDLTAARGHYQAGLDIRTRLAAADPANTEWQRDLSVSHEKLGDVAAAAGDLTAARGHYQASLDIAHPAGRRRPRQHRMAARPVRQPRKARGRRRRGRGPDRRPRPLPGQPRHRRTGWPPPTPPTPDGSATCPSATNKLGDVAAAAGDLTAARGHYQASLDIAHQAGRRRPRQHRMAARPVRQPRQARGRRRRGRGPDRRPRPLPGQPRHPHQARRRRPRQHRMAARPVHQPRKARGRRRRGRGPDRRPRPLPGQPRHRATRLAAADPANTGWQRDLSVSHNKLGDVAAAAGDLTAARGHYQAGLDIAARLAAADPANTEWQRDLSVSREQARERRRRGRGPDRRPRPLPGQPRHRAPGSPPPTPPTPNGSATCPSATKSSGTSPPRPGT